MTGLEAQSHAGKLLKLLSREISTAFSNKDTSNKDGKAAGGSGSGEERPTVAAVVDSTVKILLPKLSNKIEQQVLEAIKAALEAMKSAG